MDKILLPFKQSKLLNTLFLSNIFISFHYALIIYVNSSFLNGFFSETQVSALYIIAAIINTVLLLNASRFLEKLGVYKFAVYTVIIEFICILGMGISNTPFLVGAYFLIHTLVMSLLLFNLDMLLENATDNVELTGSIRATYLTVTSITIVLAPTLISFLLWSNRYAYVYLASAAFLVPLYFFFKRLEAIKSPQVKHINLTETVSEYTKSTDLYNIFVSSFLLQLFYAYMVIYIPLYLVNYIGFAWSEIGIMFTIMLLPFILFEMPIGEMADQKYGEKEFLTIGFIIMGLATIFISFITVQVFWIWTTVLFITRVGASFVEVSSESYFFKKVHPDKTDIISFFRISRPLSYIVAPLLATISLQFIPFQYIFLIIGSIMIIGTHYSLGLVDTK